MAMAAICCQNSFNIFCQRVKNGLHIIIFCDYQSKFDLAAKSQGSTKGHRLDILGSTQVPGATYSAAILSSKCFAILSFHSPLDTPYRIVLVVSDEMSFKNGDKLRRMTPDNYGRRQTTQPA